MKTLLCLLVVSCLTVSVVSAAEAPQAPTAVGQRGELKPGEKLFTDRDYVLQEVPQLLQNRNFLRTTIDNYEAICEEPGELYALTPSRRPRAANQELALIAHGFEKMDLPEFPLFPDDVNRVIVYRKNVEKGERFRFQKLVLLVSGKGTLIAAAKPTSPSPAETDAKIKRMEQLAELALIPPKLNTSPVPEYGYDRLDYGMTIGIERTPGGRLWACWVAGGDSPRAFFVLASSDDDGEHWSPPRLVLDSHAPDLPVDRSILVGNLWTDPRGRLWLIFDQSLDMFDGRAGVWATICDNPDAETPVWSQPRRLWHGVTLNKPTVLSTGEWMLPISLDQREGFGAFRGCFKELDPLRGANVFVSADQGETWNRRGAVQFPNPDWHEHMIVERKDGSLWMVARTSKGLMQSLSMDGGRTWSEPSLPPAIRNPNARFHLRRLASGRLLLIKHGDKVDEHQGRVQLSAWLSEDDGQTWNGGLILDERKGVSYPDGFQAPDGTIYISYDRNRSTDGEILLAKFTEQDVLAGKLTDPKSKLKLLISKPLARK
ncbi:MAG: sialidase family protein [Planctomycetota bacterium]